MPSVLQLYREREESPMNDQLYDFTRQKKLSDLLELNCSLLEKKLLFCNAKTMQNRCDESTYLGITISGAKDISILASSTPMLYVKVKCGEAVFHTHPFEKDASDWASAPMEIKWSEVPTERMLSVSIMDQTGEELSQKDVEIDLPVGHGFDRWLNMEGSACLRLQVEHKGVPSLSTSGDLEAEIAELVSKRRHLKASVDGGLPPMSYATYTTMVAEVEQRLCEEVDRLRAALGGRPLPTTGAVQGHGDGGIIRVFEEGPGGAVHVVEEPGAPADTMVVVTEDSPMVQSLLATLTARNRVIRQLQDTLASIEAGATPNASETILLLASQLEERETTLTQLKADLPALSLSALAIDQSNVINTLLSQLHKALGNLNAANKRVERLTGQATLFGGDVVLREIEDQPDAVLTQPQVAALLTRFDENVHRMRELEDLVAEQDAVIKNRENELRLKEQRLHALNAEVGDLRNADPSDIAISTARLCEQFNDSLRKFADMCFFLSGETGMAEALQDQLPSPVPLPPSPATLPELIQVLDAIQLKMADAHLMLYDEAKNALPRTERLRYMHTQGLKDQTYRKLQLKLEARDQDFEDLMADYEGVLVALATARQQLEAPIVVPESVADQFLADTCNTLIQFLPESEHAYFLSMPIRQRLPALLQALGDLFQHGGSPGVRVTPITVRGLSSQSPYVVARLGNAVQQTPSAGPGNRWGTPMTFALDGGARNLEMNIHDRNQDHSLGRANLYVDQFPLGTEQWVPLDHGGDLKVRLEKCQLGGRKADGAAPSQAQLDGIAQKLENTIDVLSRGSAHVLRPGRVTPAYLHKLADLLWELVHGGASPLHSSKPGRLPNGSGSVGRDSFTGGAGGAGAGGAGGAGGTGGLDGGLYGPGGNTSTSIGVQPDFSMVDPLGLDGVEGPTLQFLMRSRAGLIRRIWACLQICKLCNNLSSRHHTGFAQNRGHRMEVGDFKKALEDVTKLLSEVGSLEDGLAWIVANYFTDTEKRDLGTSPHLYPATGGVRALPGLIESTDIIEARRLSPNKRRTPVTRDRRDFLRRLEDAHITVLDSKDGAMDGKYFGHDLHAVQHLDGDVHGMLRRQLY